ASPSDQLTLRVSGAVFRMPLEGSDFPPQYPSASFTLQSARQIFITRCASRSETVSLIIERNAAKDSKLISGLVGARSPKTGFILDQARSHSSRVLGFLSSQT